MAFGIYLTIKQVKTFIKGKQDKFGFDIQGLGAGVMFIIIGFYIILDYL